MFCFACGEKLENPNQRFCQKCGSEIIQSEIIHSAEELESVSTPEPEKELEVPIPVPQYSASQGKVFGDEPGPDSKKALAFGIISLGIGIVSMFVGGVATMLSVLIPYPYFPFYNAYIGLTVAHLVGLIFGIVAVTSAGRAKGLETENGLMKAGNALGVIGLIIHSILLLVAIFMI